MKLKQFALAAAVALAVGVTAAHAVGPRGDGAYGPKREMGMRADGMRLINRLDRAVTLTPAQRTAIEELLRTHQQARRDHQQAMRTLRRELGALAQQNADEATIAAKAADMGQLIAAQIVARTQLPQAIRAQLTPEQQAQAEAAAWQSWMRPPHRGHYGRGMGHQHRYGWGMGRGKGAPGPANDAMDAAADEAVLADDAD